MCTVSWQQTNDGYELMCNRDERHTRKPAIFPSIQERQGVQFIAPIDGDHGGSWIAVNQFALAFCLLNRYSWILCPSSQSSPSRGLLLMEMVDCSSLDETSSRITQMELERFQPFQLIVLQPGRPCLLVHWTGRRCRVEQDAQYAMPLVSSSFDQAGVTTYRRRLFEELAAEKGQITSALLHDFHSSHSPVPSAYSPCMHREDASTVSFSRVWVTSERIEFFYVPYSPCRLSQSSKTYVTTWPGISQFKFPCRAALSVATRTGGAFN